MTLRWIVFWCCYVPLRWVVCLLKGLCWRCYAPTTTVHHERNSPWWGMKYGWYEKGCSSQSCENWVEPMRNRA